MLLTFLIDPPLCAALGAVFALAGRNLRSPRPLRAGLCVLAVFCLMMIATYPQYTDWMWGYYFDTATFSAAQHLLSVALVVVAYVLLYLAGYRWLRERRAGQRAPWPVALLIGGWLLATLGLGWQRFWRIGDYFSYHHGDAPWLHTTTFFTQYLGGVGVLAIVGVLLWRSSRCR